MGTLDNEQAAAAAAPIQEAVDVEMDDDMADDILFEQVHERREGTGETHRALSWIWTTES